MTNPTSKDLPILSNISLQKDRRSRRCLNNHKAAHRIKNMTKWLIKEMKITQWLKLRCNSIRLRSRKTSSACSNVSSLSSATTLRRSRISTLTVRTIKRSSRRVMKESLEAAWDYLVVQTSMSSTKPKVSLSNRRHRLSLVGSRTHNSTSRSPNKICICSNLNRSSKLSRAIRCITSSDLTNLSSSRWINQAVLKHWEWVRGPCNNSPQQVKMDCKGKAFSRTWCRTLSSSRMQPHSLCNTHKVINRKVASSRSPSSGKSWNLITPVVLHLDSNWAVSLQTAHKRGSSQQIKLSQHRFSKNIINSYSWISSRDACSNSQTRRSQAMATWAAKNEHNVLRGTRS